jgi:hypothetical protein
MALFTVTQQQDTRRELTYIVGVDRYLQSRCSGLVVYLLTQACHLQQLLNSLSN